jgi:CubicO group peptidase (beta-lactamase class C family)
MGGLRRLMKWVLRLFVLAVAAGGMWLYISPPDLIRVAAGYSAKMVCSNVFIAGRDAGQVLADDVQAPGHPFLKYVRVSVDEKAGTVSAGLAGVFGKGLAVFRPGLGCASVPDGKVAGAKAVALKQVEPQAANGDQPWPVGDQVAASQDPAIAAVLDDPAMAGPGMRAILVAQNGRIVAERYGEGFDGKTPLLGWSMTKTVNAAILGTLVRDGKLALTKAGLFPEWNTDNRAAITVADLMAMASGLGFDEDYGDVTDVTRMLYLQPDMAAFARDKPLAGQTGKTFSYSSGTAVLLSRIWQDALGRSDAALGYPRSALFDPLNMASATLEADEAGTFSGSSYLYANARDWARFAQMLLDNGMANGAQILPPEFVTMMQEPVTASDAGFGAQYGKGQVWLKGPSGTTPETQDRDLGFVLPADAYWMLGHDGQSICIIPSKKMIVLRMGLTPSKLNYKPQALVQRLVAVLP